MPDRNLNLHKRSCGASGFGDQNDHASARAGQSNGRRACSSPKFGRLDGFAPGNERLVVAAQRIFRQAGFRRAIAHVTGFGQYEMSLNGTKSAQTCSRRVGRITTTRFYDTRDITAQLREGANAVGLTLGNGMYHVERRNRFAKFTGSFGPLRDLPDRTRIRRRHERVRRH